MATIWTGKTELRPGLKSTGSLIGCWFVNRLSVRTLFNVVLLIFLTFISVLLLSYLHIHDEWRGQLRTSAGEFFTDGRINENLKEGRT